MNRTKDRISSHIFQRIFMTSSLTTFALIGAGFIDSLVVSHFFGTDAIAAAGLAYPFYFLCGIVFGCISTAFKSLASRNLGQGDVEGFRRVFNVNVTLSVLIAAVMTAVLLLLPRPLAFVFGARGNSADLLDLTAQYLTGLSVGCPALILNSILSGGLQFDNGSRAIKIANFAGMAADVVLDLTVVACGWGMFAIGLASSVSAYLTFLILCLQIRRSKLLDFHPVLPQRPELREIVYLGSDRILYRLQNLLRPLIINPFVISLGGTGAMAALSVRNSLMSFVAIPGYGISDGVSVTADVAYNLKSRDELRATGWLAHFYSALFELTPGILLCLLSRPIAALYMPEASPEDRSLLVFALCAGGIKLLFETLLTARISYLQAVGKIQDAKWLLRGSNFAAVILSVLLMGKLFGAYGVMASFTVADVVSMIFIYLNYSRRKHDWHVTVDDYLKVAEECDVSPGDMIELTVKTDEDCSLTAEQVQLFCRGHGADARYSMHAGICAEEALTLLLRCGEIKFHMTYSQGKARMHFRVCSPESSLGAELERLRSGSGNAETESEKLLGAFASEISMFRALDVENLILIV